MITLDKTACNDCLICHAICPNYVFGVAAGPDGKKVVDTAYPEQCCECWQCIAACPRNALSADGIRVESFERAAPAEIPPAAMRGFLLSRRSVRAYKPEAPSDETIQRLLEAGTYAATSSNGQSEAFLVIRAGEFLAQLETLVIQAIWNAGLKYLDGGLVSRVIAKGLTRMYGAEMARQYQAYFLIIKHRREHDDLRGMIFRDAPLLIVAHGLKKNELAQTNCALAVRNMQMLALSMGLGTCNVGFLTVAARKSKKIDRFLGLAPDRTVCASILVGYPRYRVSRVPVRKPRDVRWI